MSGTDNITLIGREYNSTKNVIIIGRKVVDTSGGTNNRVRKQFNETPDGINTIFTSPVNFIASGDFTEWVFKNGNLLEQGIGCDYLSSESGGVGTGFDTITFASPPRTGDRLDIILIAS